jgi:hypothetical protein
MPKDRSFQEKPGFLDLKLPDKLRFSTVPGGLL